MELTPTEKLKLLKILRHLQGRYLTDINVALGKSTDDRQKRFLIEMADDGRMDMEFLNNLIERGSI